MYMSYVFIYHNAGRYVPHNVEDLISLYGGNELFEEKLDTFFEGGYYDHGRCIIYGPRLVGSCIVERNAQIHTVEVNPSIY